MGKNSNTFSLWLWFYDHFETPKIDLIRLYKYDQFCRPKFEPIGSMGRTVYLPTNLPWKNEQIVATYTSPMDPMGEALQGVDFGVCWTWTKKCGILNWCFVDGLSLSKDTCSQTKLVSKSKLLRVSSHIAAWFLTVHCEKPPFHQPFPCAIVIH